MATGLGKRLLNKLPGGKGRSEAAASAAVTPPAPARSTAAPGRGGTVVSSAPSAPALLPLTP